MGLFGGAIERLKLKAAEIAAHNLAEAMERGDYGPTLQTIYVKTKGQKTFIGTILTLLFAAVTEYAPPYATDFFRYFALVTTGLTALGLLDKLRRNEPIFPIWFLEALAKVTLWLTTIEAAFTWLVTHGWFEGLVVSYGGAMDRFTFCMTALTTATAFVNRAAKASAAMPKDANQEEPKK